MVFTFHLSREMGTPVSMSYSTQGRGATEAVDFESRRGTIVFNPGETTKQVSITVRGDRIQEADEFVILRLSNVRGANLDRSEIQGTIRNDDTPTLVVSDASIIEGNRGGIGRPNPQLTFTLTLSERSTRTISVDYATQGLSATAGGDFRTTHGRVTFRPWDVSGQVRVEVLPDNAIEGDETLALQLFNASNGLVLSRTAATGTILNDDGVVSASAAASVAMTTARAAAVVSGPNIVISRPSYDYVPTVIYENGIYRMWWCGGGAGDYIYYSQSTNPSTGWTTPRVVFRPTGSSRDFDGLHTCDPSVIKIGSTYYMYYGGHPTPNSRLPQTTMIGLATSHDGINWRRTNGGDPIIRPRNFNAHSPHAYGAGQPSATYVDGKVYLTFHDSTAPAANSFNGGGVYVIRSTDPLFDGRVDELTASGFVTRRNTSSLRLDYKLFDAFSVDWQFSDQANAFLMSVHGIGGQSSVLTFDRNFQLRGQQNLPNVPWTEGPGVAHRSDGHSLAANANQTLPWRVFYSTGTGGPETWDLAFSNFDLVTNRLP